MQFTKQKENSLSYIHSTTRMFVEEITLASKQFILTAELATESIYNYFCNWCESTTISPSGLGLGHQHAISLN